MNISNGQVAALLQFVNGLSLALVLAFIALQVRHALKLPPGRKKELFDGVAFGVVGIAIMLFPFSSVPGVGLDARAVPIALAGLFSGPLATITASFILTAYRLSIGGVGVVAGIALIASAAVFGIALARFWLNALDKITPVRLFLAGLCLAAITLGCTLILPHDAIDPSIAAFTLAVLITHPLGIVILGSLLLYEEKRRRTERALRESQARLSAIAENSPTAIYLKDLEGRYTLINDLFAARFGNSPDEIIGKSTSDVFPPELVPNILEQDRLVLDSGKPHSFEVEMPYVDGTNHIEMTTKFPIIGPDGAVTALGGITTDITDWKRSEEEAKDLRDRLAHVARIGTMGEMATGFAHELNQPLTAINNYARGILKRVEKGRLDPAETATALEQLSKQAERAGEIIRRIRSFVKKNAPAKSPTDLNRAILDALAFLKGDATDAKIDLQLALDRQLPKVPTDAVQIQQVVINLAKNAIEALQSVEDGPRVIEIGTLSLDDNAIQVIVSDSGPGLPPEIAADLFEPFVTTKADGMGIGLSICRSTIQAHGGELTAAPRSGGGTVFRFSLPVSENG